MGRIHPDLIRADPSDPPNPWSILDQNTPNAQTRVLLVATQIGQLSEESNDTSASAYLSISRYLADYLACSTHQILRIHHI